MKLDIFLKSKKYKNIQKVWEGTFEEEKKEGIWKQVIGKPHKAFFMGNDNLAYYTFEVKGGDKNGNNIRNK